LTQSFYKAKQKPANNPAFYKKGLANYLLESASIAFPFTNHDTPKAASAIHSSQNTGLYFASELPSDGIILISKIAMIDNSITSAQVR